MKRGQAVISWAIPATGKHLKLLAGQSSGMILGGETSIMNLQELIHAVPVHMHAGRRYFVRLGDIPDPWRSEFIEALHGSACPVLDGEGKLAFAWDWEAWAKGRWPGRSAPTGLDFS